MVLTSPRPFPPVSTMRVMICVTIRRVAHFLCRRHALLPAPNIAAHSLSGRAEDIDSQPMTFRWQGRLPHLAAMAASLSRSSLLLCTVTSSFAFHSLAYCAANKSHAGHGSIHSRQGGHLQGLGHACRWRSLRSM